MKKLLIKTLQLLFRNPGFFLKFKDTAMVNGAEHLWRCRQYIYRMGFNGDAGLIVDVGAANGHTCLWFASNFPRHQVIGFEPMNDAYKKAAELCSSNTNIQLHNIALSSESGDAILHITEDALASSLKKTDHQNLDHLAPEQKQKLTAASEQMVKKKPLDDVLPGDQVLLLKLDTQGTELEVLKGAVGTLRKTRLVLCEMNNHSLYEDTAMYYEVDGFLRDNNFVLVDIYVTYRPGGRMQEYDALYQNNNL